MTASSPAPLDPLAAPVVAPAAAVQPVVAGSLPEPKAAGNKKSIAPLLLLGLGGLLILMLIGGGMAALFFMPPAKPPRAIVTAPVPPDPGTPPPLAEHQLAGYVPQAKRDGEQDSQEHLRAALTTMPPQFLITTGETVAPKEMIVRGGGLGDAAGLEVPSHERWQIHFATGITIEAYTRQLDFFKIELGVIGGSKDVTYLSSFSNPKPTSRTAPGYADTRLYLIWNRGPLREADEILVTRAGLNPEGKVLAHFCPPELEAAMLRLEATHAEANKLTHLRRTVFGIQAAGADAFQLVVLEQQGD